MQTIYRDSKTGRFAKKSSWQKAKRRGSKRFKRERIERKPIHPPRPPEQLKTFFVVFTYVNARGKRQFDFFVRTTDRSRVESYVKKYVKGNKKFEVPPDAPLFNIFTRLQGFGMTREIAEIPPEEFNEFYDKPEGFVSHQ